MDSVDIKNAGCLKGEFAPAPDKSVSHRAIIFSSISRGKSVIRNFLHAEDPLCTLNAFRSLGVEIEEKNGEIHVRGKGIHGLKEPADVIDCGNSGTTMRLVAGVLAGNGFFSVLNGDASLRSRPMGRIILPLQQMGALITARAENRYPPLAILGKPLAPLRYILPVASAQVKSALLLAGLYAEGNTEITEPSKSRDHTERMLPSFGADISVDGLRVRVKGGPELNGTEVFVPGDFSSAAFFLIGSLLLRDSDLTIRDVGINPTRTGLLAVLQRMGADIQVVNQRNVSGEPIADIHCTGPSQLKAVDISGEEIPSLIDEFPILCVAATQAEGTTTISGAGELRVKESDRIRSMATELGKMGADIRENEDGLCITGRSRLKGAVCESHGDHRVAMALSIAGLCAQGSTRIHGFSVVNISFPGFLEHVMKLTKG